MNKAAEVLLRAMAANGDVFQDYAPDRAERPASQSPIVFQSNSVGEWVRA